MKAIILSLFLTGCVSNWSDTYPTEDAGNEASKDAGNDSPCDNSVRHRTCVPPPIPDSGNE